MLTRERSLVRNQPRPSKIPAHARNRVTLVGPFVGANFFGGGSDAALRGLLTPDVTWIVPGDNPSAGTYRGVDEVFDYIRQRRDVADGTFRMKRLDVLVGAGDRIAALTDGYATQSAASSATGQLSASTRSPTGASLPAGCSRSTHARLTRFGRADRRWVPGHG
jgi:hypothetical protein